MPQIFSRDSKFPESHDFSFYKNYRVQRTSDGKKEFIECEPVSKGLASEFSVESNVAVNRPQRSQYRVNVDPVDLETFVEQNK